MANSFRTHILIRFKSNGLLDTKHCTLSGAPNIYAQNNLLSGPYLIDDNCSLTFMARSVNGLIQGLAGLKGCKIVGKSWMGEAQATLPARKFQASLQKWDTPTRRSRVSMGGLGLLDGFGFAKRLAGKLQRHMALEISTSAGVTAGTQIALGARTQSGGIDSYDGVSQILCSDLAGILQSEIRRPEFRGTKIR